MRRYLGIWLILTGSLVLLTAAINLVVDPYGLFRLIDVPGVNAVKPNAGAHGGMVKPYQVLRVNPAGLILGNSRAEVGFDPLHASWPAEARPVYNLALPGSGTSTARFLLEHVIAYGDIAQTGGIRVVVWGIDFMDFLVDPSTAAPRAPSASGGGRLLKNLDGSLNAGRTLQQVRDVGSATLGLGALLDSLDTLRSQWNPYASDLTAAGFNPMRDYVKITADEGFWAVFRQRDVENLKAYLRRPNAIFLGAGQSSPAFDDVLQVLRRCRERGIALYLVVYPYHAHLQEIIRITGLWPAYEAWKRAVVEVVERDAIDFGGKPVPIWDFSGFNDFTTEPVPPKGDRLAATRWYWEAGHFKRELGDRILERMFNGNDTDATFGVLLTRANVESHLVAIRARQADYLRAYAIEIGDLERIARDLDARRSAARHGHPDSARRTP